MWEEGLSPTVAAWMCKNAHIGVQLPTPKPPQGILGHASTEARCYDSVGR